MIKKFDPHAALFFLMPHSLEEVERRLRARQTESKEQIEIRLVNAKREISEAVKYDYLIINESVERAAEQIRDAMTALFSLQKRGFSV